MYCVFRREIKNFNSIPKWVFSLLLIISASSAMGDGESDFAEMCQGCHGSSIDVSAYNFVTLRDYIHRGMPPVNETLGTEPADCIGDCARDIAGFLLPKSERAPRYTTDFRIGSSAGAAPFEADFSADFTRCDDTPCTVSWDFGDGDVVTQSSDREDMSDLANISHTFTTVGTHRVLVTITDDAGKSTTRSVFIYVIEEEESFADYVETCKAELGFSDGDIPNNLNCATGYVFDNDGEGINDFVDYRRVTDQVDLVYACRWLQNGTGVNEVVDPPFIFSESIEMIMHNRENGKTCFFRAEEHEIAVSDPDDPTRKGALVEIVSPTVAASASPGTPEYQYWQSPLELAETLPCVDCHVAGPYIASDEIAPFLQRFGLLNDGHDTFGRQMLGQFASYGNYLIPGETFSFMNHLAATGNAIDSCAEACHSLGSNSFKDRIRREPPPPSEKSFITLIPRLSSKIRDIDALGTMPVNRPLNGESPDASVYAWINQDTPYSPDDVGDVETIFEAKKEFAGVLSNCGKPGLVEAHAVDSDLVFHPYELPDQLDLFNAIEGLRCLNREQEGGVCADYSVRYQCTDSQKRVAWTQWYNTDSPTNTSDYYSGDYETRDDHTGECSLGFPLFDLAGEPLAADQMLGNQRKITGIEAKGTLANGSTYSGYGPKDRLAEFNKTGLICLNEEQPDGQCSNYVVKYIACSGEPDAYNINLVAPSSGVYLTASGDQNNDEARGQPYDGTWNSQTWLVEAIPDSDYVRLKIPSSGKYLQVQDNYENAPVIVYDFMEEWGSQQWLIESVEGSTDVRLKDAWTGRYLTLHDYGDYSEIWSQDLRLDWDTQRWQLK